jgi:hypothetical protein
MWVAVVMLRRQGLRLKRGELAVPVEGDLRIGDAGQNNFARPMLAARLWSDAASVEMPLGVPLFEPAVVHAEGDTFSLRGIELAVVEGRLMEHSQVWRCTLLHRPARAGVDPRRR